MEPGCLKGFTGLRRSAGPVRFFVERVLHHKVMHALQSNAWLLLWEACEACLSAAEPCDTLNGKDPQACRLGSRP